MEDLFQRFLSKRNLSNYYALTKMAPETYCAEAKQRIAEEMKKFETETSIKKAA